MCSSLNIYIKDIFFSKKISFYEFYGFFIKETGKYIYIYLTAKEKNIKEILTEIMNSLKKKKKTEIMN
jgi:hypothetical protein